MEKARFSDAWENRAYLELATLAFVFGFLMLVNEDRLGERHSGAPLALSLQGACPQTRANGSEPVKNESGERPLGRSAPRRRPLRA